MKKSNYFYELFKTYLDELDDLTMDSGGKKVLQKRLDEKRQQIDAILQMIEYSPEMVAVIFYGAFEYKFPKIMRHLVLIDPEELDLPEWAQLTQNLSVEEWAKPLISKVLEQEGGDAFLVCAAALEFMRTHDRHAEDTHDQESAEDSSDEGSDDAEGNGDDLGEAGHNWLQEQGFDTRED